MNNAEQTEIEVNKEPTCKDTWRKITCRTRKILNEVPEDTGTLIKIDFKNRTYEVVE